jgi:hypothetical protein
VRGQEGRVAAEVEDLQREPSDQRLGAPPGGVVLLVVAVNATVVIEGVVGVREIPGASDLRLGGAAGP